jgi:hypothetical protein
MADLVAVRFVKRFAPYNIGEVAGFSSKNAVALIKGGLAVPFQEEGVGTSGAIVPVHTGGGWYQVGDQKIRGKAAAEALAAELNEGK